MRHNHGNPTKDYDLFIEEEEPSVEDWEEWEEREKKSKQNNNNVTKDTEQVPEIRGK